MPAYLGLAKYNHRTNLCHLPYLLATLCTTKSLMEYFSMLPATRFVLLFDAKEGTTAMMQLFQQLPGVSVVRNQSPSLEPFDRHACREITFDDLKTCLNKVLSAEPADLEQLNQIYMKTAASPLVYDPAKPLIGFKMRLQARRGFQDFIGRFSQNSWLLSNARAIDKKLSAATLFKLFKKHRVTVFVVIRKDLLRWGLSKYHGDGSGREGHLQFQLARGKITRDEIPKIHVAPHKLRAIIRKCQWQHREKRGLLNELSRRGIRAFPLFYEDFVADKESFLKGFYTHLGLVPSERDIAHALSKPTNMQRVHSEDISSFVVNHQEILKRFSGIPQDAW